MIYRQQHHRLDELRLDDGAFDLDYRLAGEYRGALGHRPHIAGESEVCKVVEEILAEALASQIVDIFLAEAEISEIIHKLLNAGHNHITAAVGHGAEKHIKICNGILKSVFEVAVRHGQLIEIAEHGQVDIRIRLHDVLFSFHIRIPDEAFIRNPNRSFHLRLLYHIISHPPTVWRGQICFFALL